jgi:hypothetical protein
LSLETRHETESTLVVSKLKPLEYESFKNVLLSLTQQYRTLRFPKFTLLHRLLIRHSSILLRPFRILHLLLFLPHRSIPEPSHRNVRTSPQDNGKNTEDEKANIIFSCIGVEGSAVRHAKVFVGPVVWECIGLHEK